MVQKWWLETTRASARPGDPSFEREEASRLWDEHTQKFDIEDGSDGPWASRTSDGLRAELGPIIADADGQITGLECRASMCRLEMQWNSLREAKLGTKRAMGRRLETLNCAQHSRVEEGENRGSILFDCTEG
jgi:hypothetical protein